MPRRSTRFEALPAFPLAEMKAARRRLEAEGVDVIDLGAGAASLAPPPAVIEQCFKHPLTEIGLERFLKDWEKAQAAKVS